MARELLNTLYVTTQGAYVHLDNQTLTVEVGDETRLRVPVHHLGSVVCFGRVSVSPAAMAQCAEEQRDLVFLSRSGRFRAKIVGPTSGNVLLRLAQHQAFQDPDRSASIARNIVAAKVQNARLLLMREARRRKTRRRRRLCAMPQRPWLVLSKPFQRLTAWMRSGEARVMRLQPISRSSTA